LGLGNNFPLDRYSWEVGNKDVQIAAEISVIM